MSNTITRTQEIIIEGLKKRNEELEQAVRELALFVKYLETCFGEVTWQNKRTRDFLKNPTVKRAIQEGK